MSIETIKEEMRALKPEDRRMLMAYLVALEDENRAGYAAELARRIDDELMTGPPRNG